MRKHVVALALLGAMGIMLLQGCGGANSINSSLNSQTGSLVVFGTDAPSCDVFSFQVTITGATLTPANGGAPVPIISSGDSITVDFARLVGFASILKFSNVPVGTYSELTLTLSNPQLTVLDVTQTPPAPVPVASTTLTTSTVTVRLQPELTVSSGGAAGLMIDFRLRKSVQTDANGQVTGLVDPIFRAGMTIVSSEEGVGVADELHGLVGSVTPTSSNPAFTGSFTLQTRGGVGPVFTVNVTSNTRFEGVTDLSGLMPSTFVEVDAKVDTSGDIVAKEVEVEEQESEAGEKAAFLGSIISINRDPSGNATQFALLVFEEHPELTDSVPIRSPLTVNVLATTMFGITRPGINEAQLAFNATTLGLGESVVVHGVVQPGSPASVNANSIFLRPRTVLGNFTSLLAAAGDDKTGGFTLVPCGSIFKGQPITVLTFPDTSFIGVSGLIGLGPKPTIGVRGLLFYEQASGSANGASWTAPTWVFEARRVRQFPD